MNSAASYMIFGVVGWSAAVLINYLADVLPVQRRLARPTCQTCGQPLSLIPYLLMLPRCQSCGRFRSLRTAIVALLCVAGFIWFGIHPPERLGLAAGWLWMAYFLLVIVIDVEHRLILHWVTGVGAVMALIAGSSLHGWVDTLLGGAVGALVMLSLYLLGIGYARWSSRRRGQEIAEGEALGFGDVTLSGVIGLLLGWPGVIAGLVLAIVLAGIVALLALMPMLVRRKYDANLALPYGPFLSLGAFYLLYFR